MSAGDAAVPSDDPAARLLNRQHPARYLEAWTRSLTRSVVDEGPRSRFSAGVVRMGDELFALPTRSVVEVQLVPAVRRLPGRTNDVFAGLVSLRGEIHLCASLHALFGLSEVERAAAGTDGDERRLVVVERDGERWALIVDQVLDFRRFDADEVQAAQSTVAKSAVHFTDGVVPTEAGPAARIDVERLFHGLARSLR